MIKEKRIAKFIRLFEEILLYPTTELFVALEIWSGKNQGDKKKKEIIYDLLIGWFERTKKTMREKNQANKI